MNVVTFNLRRTAPRVSPPPTLRTDPRRGDRGAQQLALAYAVEQAIEAGDLRDHAHAAALLGLTRARMSQVAALRWLSPEIQARVLAGENIHERSLRAAMRCVDWTDQLAALKEKVR